MKIRPAWMWLPDPFAYRLAFPGDAKREAVQRRAARKAAREAARGTSRQQPPAPLRGTLRAFRGAALWGIAVLIVTAAGAAFAESYRGLWLWAQHHGHAGFWAAAFPLQVDLFVAVGELVLFVAMTDRWSWRDRAGAWTVALLGLAASVAGNVGHVAAHDLQSRGTAAVPPLAAFAALWLGLGVLKRIVRHDPVTAPVAPPVADETAQEDGYARGEVMRLAERVGELAGAVSLAAARTDETALLADLADAVRSLAAKADGEVPSAAPGADETVLLGELLEAVRDLGARIGGITSVPVPSGVEHAALIACRASVAAGYPYSMNALQARFGLTRSQAEKVRAAIGDEFGGPQPQEIPRLRRLNADPGTVNGSHPS